MKRFKRAKDVRVGVIGYGGAFAMGKIHLDQMRDFGMTPTAVCDPDPSRLKIAAADFDGIETYTSASRMLATSKVNLVTIITPHNTHAKLALQCLNAGRDVVSEKPFAITVGQCDAMIAAAGRQRRMLSTYHNRHWDGCILEAIDQIHKRKVIGDVVNVNIRTGSYAPPGAWWRSSKSISGGILYDWGVHFLEYALQIINDDMLEVTGFNKNGFWAPRTPWKEDTNEDASFGAVRFKNEKWLTLSMSQIDADAPEGILRITGTRGTYVMDHFWYEIIQPKPNGATVRTRGRNRDSEEWRFYDNIAKHLTRGTRLIITPEWARRPIQIIETIGKSAKAQRAVKVKYP